jgi:hypothetical protein
VKKEEYYFCYIGPTDRERLDKRFPNGEGHLRSCIQNAFYEVTEHDADLCGSGWGVKQNQIDHISFATYDDELKEVVINSYLKEKKKCPDTLKRGNYY